MIYSIQELLSHLKMDQQSFTELKNYRSFCKQSSSNQFGDLVSVCCTEGSRNTEFLKTELEKLVEESQRNQNKISVDSFSLHNNQIYLKLNRLSTIRSVFSDIFESHTTYGCSKKLLNKAFHVQYGESRNELTELRMRTAGRVVAELIALGGGCVTDCPDAEVVHVSPRPGSSVLVGSVHIAGSSDTTKEFYVKMRRTELEMSDHRELSEELVEQLVSANVVFDLLSVKLTKALVLRSSAEPPSSRRSNCKGATFVLYNFARVCAILDKYELMVGSGVYKPLTSFNELALNLLKEEEWRLVFDFLAEWPNVVSECQDMNQPKLHNMVAFLSSLASTFSVFYKYNRVLKEGLEHMVPLMEARIHLLKAIKIVFLVAFSLLGIRAPTKM